MVGPAPAGAKGQDTLCRIFLGRAPLKAIASALAVITVSFAALPASAAEDDQSAHLVVSHASVSKSSIRVGVTFVSGPDDPLGRSPSPDSFAALEAEQERPDMTRRVGGEDLEIGIVVDTNPGGHDLESVKTSIRQLVEGLPTGTRISLTEASLTPVPYVEPTADKEAVLTALQLLGRGTGTDLPEAMNKAIDGFSSGSGTFRTVVLYANRYSARTNTTEFLADRIEAQEISTYLVSPERSLAGSIAAEFPLPLGGGRRIISVDEDLLRTGALLANELSHQYEVILPSEMKTFETGVEIRATWQDETLTGVTIVKLRPRPEPTGNTADPETTDPIVVLRLLGLVLIAAAVLFIPPRLRASFFRARRSRPSSTKPMPVVEAEGALSLALPETPWTLDGSVTVSGPDWTSSMNRTSSLGGDRVEGRRAVHELLRAQTRRTRGIWLVEGLDDPLTLELAEAAHVPVRRVDARTFEAVAASAEPEGVLGFAEPITAVSIDDLRLPDLLPPAVLVVDGPVEDHGRFAALLRAAVTAGADGLVFDRTRSMPLPPITTALAGGAVEHLRFAGVGNLAPAVSRLRALGFMVIALDPNAVVSLDELHREVGLSSIPVALVAGIEGATDRRLAARCDVTVRVHRPGEPEAGDSIGEWACWELGQLRLPASTSAEGAI